MKGKENTAAIHRVRPLKGFLHQRKIPKTASKEVEQTDLGGNSIRQREKGEKRNVF